ncbi:MAG: energy transducer TonB [Paludibacter sp.]|nr:energy transducer TonB [Paludibacter sp.]
MAQKIKKLRFGCSAMYLGVLLLSIGITACNNSGKSSENTTIDNKEMMNTKVPEYVCFPSDINEKDAPNENGIFSRPEQMPKFEGGEDALIKFLVDNVKYPNPDICVEGRVTARFVVEKDGSISNIEILRSLHPLLDKEAIRVIEMMPKFKPAMQDGEVVRCYFTLPVYFRIQIQ